MGTIPTGDEETVDAEVRPATADRRWAGRRPPGREERLATGRAVRDEVPWASLAALDPAPERDALGILVAQNERRVPELVPLRFGRMSAGPFAYLRGAAAVMAADLATATPTSLSVQLCGDAHVSNFGGFAAPDRRIVLDLNDFDETLPGPFEWDVKRLAASVAVATRGLGGSRKDARRATLAAVASYRSTIARASAVDPLALWYHRLELDEVAARATEAAGSKSERKAAERAAAKARARAARKDRFGALAKLTEEVDGRRRFRHDPPLLERLDDERLATEIDRVEAFLDHYVSTLADDRRALLARFVLRDVARKVVGVGSVGTRCYLGLFESGDGEPLLLQIKEATSSVLEAHLEASRYDQAGQRVVEGQRLIQSASDPFLGWARLEPIDAPEGDFYLRQLWDGKLSADIDAMDPGRFTRHAQLCAAILARAHARTGDAAAICGYVGDDPDEDGFDRAVAEWAVAYGELTVGDHAALVTAVEAGSVEATTDA